MPSSLYLFQKMGVIFVTTIVMLTSNTALSGQISDFEGSQWQLVSQTVGVPGKKPRFVRLHNDFPQPGFYDIGGGRHGRIQRVYFPVQMFVKSNSVVFLPANIELELISNIKDGSVYLKNTEIMEERHHADGTYSVERSGDFSQSDSFTLVLSKNGLRLQLVSTIKSFTSEQIVFEFRKMN